jgi:NADP-dependent 3-hydroxy acid dehydrogenase YdfG
VSNASAGIGAELAGKYARHGFDPIIAARRELLLTQPGPGQLAEISASLAVTNPVGTGISCLTAPEVTLQQRHR